MSESILIKQSACNRSAWSTSLSNTKETIAQRSAGSGKPRTNAETKEK